MTKVGSKFHQILNLCLIFLPKFFIVHQSGEILPNLVALPLHPILSRPRRFMTPPKYLICLIIAQKFFDIVLIYIIRKLGLKSSKPDSLIFYQSEGKFLFWKVAQDLIKMST